MLTHTQNPVSKDVAEAEFERFLEAMDLKDRTDPARLDDDDKKNLARLRDSVIAEIEAGRVVILEDGRLSYTPKVGDTKAITFNEPDGACIMAMDKLKQGHNVAKANAVLGAMTGEGPARFAKMKQRDLRVCNDLLTLFLA